MSETRKLAAILVADIVGYGWLAGADEERTLARLRGLRSDLIDPTIAVHNVRLVKRGVASGPRSQRAGGASVCHPVECDRPASYRPDRRHHRPRDGHQGREIIMANIISGLGLGPPPALAPLRAKWGWIVALGVVYVVAGVIALGSVISATVATVFVVGIMMIIAGVAEVINAFQIKTWGRFLFWLALGILYIIAGFVAFENPLLTAAWLTLILGAALCASGIVRIFLSFNMQHGSPWIWVVVSGVITLLLGLIILAHWPVSSLWTLGIFLGVDLVFAGASWIGIGIGLRQGSPV
jgi:uncharacterized membrane protein HdeD (DUF308 family)